MKNLKTVNSVTFNGTADLKGYTKDALELSIRCHLNKYSLQFHIDFVNDRGMYQVMVAKTDFDMAVVSFEEFEKAWSLRL